MARPREFDENTVLDAAVARFWSRGYESTSVRDLAEAMGITGASLYNAFGDKRSLYKRAMERYSETGTAVRVMRQEGQYSPRQAITAMFDAIIAESLNDEQHRGCLVVNAALELAAHDAACRDVIEERFSVVKAYFQRAVQAGQADGTIICRLPAEELAQHLLGIMLALRVLARVTPDRCMLEAIVRPAYALLDGTADSATP